MKLNTEITHYTKFNNPKMAVLCRGNCKLFFLIILLFSLFAVSCTTEVTMSVQPDDSVAINFEGGAGAAFTKMISSVAAGETGTDGTNVIDTAAVSYELGKAGFSDVKVEQKKGGLVQINMKDKKCSSYIFNSGIIKADKGRLSAAVTRKSLEDFYNSADEQTRMTLDLFLAPVFNNEDMSEAEYLEMLGSFYGAGAADEVSKSIVKINLISKDGKKEVLNYSLAQLLCGLL